jgi:hypothetical protein
METNFKPGQMVTLSHTGETVMIVKMFVSTCTVQKGVVRFPTRIEYLQEIKK